MGTACAKFHPRPSSSAAFHQRLQTQTQGGLEVSASVLGHDEGREYFGVKLAKKHVQAVYLKIRNHEKKPCWLMPISIDPNYYSANEVAYRHRTGRSGKIQLEMNEFFEAQQIPWLVEPGKTVEGFVYTNVDFGSKEFSVDLLGKGKLKRFAFVVPVPGLAADYQEVDFPASIRPRKSAASAWRNCGRLCGPIPVARRKRTQRFMPGTPSTWWWSATSTIF